MFSSQRDKNMVKKEDPQKKRLKKELEHLEKTYKSGIMKKSEFMKGKERVEKKIKDIDERKKLEEKKKKIVHDILNQPKPSKKPVVKKATVKTKPKKVSQKPKEPKPTVVKIQETNNREDIGIDDFEEDSGIWKFALVVLLIFLAVLLYIKWTSAPDYQASVILTEYSDFACSHCADSQVVLNQIEEAYGSQIEFKFKHFPREDINPGTLLAAQAAECANDQGKFWEYHDMLFANQNFLEQPALEQYAIDLGLDYAQFVVCLDSEEKLDIILHEKEHAEDLGIQYSPSFMINDKLIVGAHSFEVFKEVIDAELK